MSRVFCCAALLAACSGSATRTPVRTPAAAPLAVESCSTLGEASGGRTCAIYDTQAKAFVDTAAADPLERRALLYDRWMDLYNSADRQEVIRNMKDAFEPGDPESKWGDETEIAYWDDAGDSAGFGDTLMNSVMFRYAVTGTESDYQRFEGWLRGQVQKWDATGMDGYLARWFYALVPPGTQIRNGLAMDTGGDKFVTPAAALPRMPAWFAGQDARWTGHTSIDAYSGPMNSWPLAFPLVRDAALKARMARHYGCFLKRLQIFKIVKLSKNAQLQADVARYLTSSVLNLDPDDPDLTRLDQIWGFYLPQYNTASASAYPAACPDHLATDATAAETIDVTVPGFDGKLLDLILRQTGSDQADSMDFAFYPSVRAGDAVMLIAYALGAYELTGDPEFLKWRDEVLIAKANAREVGRTIGAFELPRPCRSYYRTRTSTPRTSCARCSTATRARAASRTCSGRASSRPRKSRACATRSSRSSTRARPALAAQASTRRWATSPDWAARPGTSTIAPQLRGRPLGEHAGGRAHRDRVAGGARRLLDADQRPRHLDPGGQAGPEREVREPGAAGDGAAARQLDLGEGPVRGGALAGRRRPPAVHRARLHRAVLDGALLRLPPRDSSRPCLEIGNPSSAPRRREARGGFVF